MYVAEWIVYDCSEQFPGRDEGYGWGEGGGGGGGGEVAEKNTSSVIGFGELFRTLRGGGINGGGRGGLAVSLHCPRLPVAENEVGWAWGRWSP